MHTTGEVRTHFLEEQVQHSDAASAAILIQMWNLAGPVTNGCDDVWGRNLPISYFYSAYAPRRGSVKYTKFLFSLS